MRAQMEGKDITHLLKGVAGELECDPSELAAMKKSATDETVARCQQQEEDEDEAPPHTWKPPLVHGVEAWDRSSFDVGSQQ